MHRDSRVSFQRDSMWHFNALFQPAKCLICKTRSRSSCSFAVRVSLPPSSSLFSLFECGHPPSVSLSLSRSLFSFLLLLFLVSPLPSIGSRGPGFRVALLLLFLLHNGRPCYLWKPIALRYEKKMYETFFPFSLLDHPVDTGAGQTRTSLL